MGFNYRRLLDQDDPCPECKDDDCNGGIPPSNGKNHPPPKGRCPPDSRVNVMACLIGGVLLFSIFFILLRTYYLRRNNRRSERESEGEGEGEGVLSGSQEDFFDEERGMHLVNPIWYINTVGLQQSVIDSIAVFKYKNGEGLIDGTDCSVCLNEFQEDESLRLLPKCNHAFHINCIDTWLKSHKNCPLCRAPIVCDAVVDQASVSMPDVNVDSGSREETQVGDSENHELGGNDVGEDGNSEMVTRDDNLGTLPTKDENTAGSSKKGLPHSKSRVCDSEFRVPTDLAEIRQRVVEDVQPIRRSVSLDSPSAMMIYSAVAGLRQGEHPGNMETELARVKNTRSKVVSKKGSGSSTKRKMMKSSSIDPFVSKGSISVKRSLSSGGKFLFGKGKKLVLDPSLVNLRSV
ncbi:hypothetical protein SLE2022_367150 [Rubroshorea leprosula]